MLPFDINGEESHHVSGAAAHCGCERFSLAVAEEKHLKYMRVIDRHTTAGYLTVAFLESDRNIVHHYGFLHSKKYQNADLKPPYYHFILLL